MTAIVDGDRTPASGPSRSVSTTNACRMCMPLGACLAFAGFDGTVPFLHGSQGCATYIRRYLISHFSEPMDIASSSVGEAATVFGGESNLVEGIANVARVYRPQMIGVATTCLTETIGEDVPPMLRRFAESAEAERAESERAESSAATAAPEAAPSDAPSPQTAPPRLVHAPTPSYAGTHADGYQAAVAATVGGLAVGGERGEHVVVLPSIVSTADLRLLREMAHAYGVDHALLPDYSDRLDGVATGTYDRLPPGGTPLADVERAGSAAASVTLGGLTSPGVALAGDVLESRHGVPAHRMPLPVGIRLTDRFTALLGELSGRDMPDTMVAERGRLVDAYIDGHKYVAERTAVVFADEDLALGLSVWLAEIGITPAVIATGGRSGRLADELALHAPELAGRVTILDDADFQMIGDAAADAAPDLLVGHSKGYQVARRLGVPLVRVGMPIHDRVGAQRVLHLGYRGAQQLFDRVANALIEHHQDASPVGYAYM